MITQYLMTLAFGIPLILGAKFYYKSVSLFKLIIGWTIAGTVGFILGFIPQGIMLLGCIMIIVLCIISMIVIDLKRAIYSNQWNEFMKRTNR